MYRWLFIAAAPVALIVLLACSADRTTSSNEAGLLEGTVTIAPLCPVEHPDENCKPDLSIYTSHFLVITRLDGRIEGDPVPISKDGKYQTQIAAGKYLVDYTPQDIGIPGTFTPPQAIVEAGKTTVLNIRIDTGIR